MEKFICYRSTHALSISTISYFIPFSAHSLTTTSNARLQSTQNIFHFDFWSILVVVVVVFRTVCLKDSSVTEKFFIRQIDPFYRKCVCLYECQLLCVFRGMMTSPLSTRRMALYVMWEHWCVGAQTPAWHACVRIHTHKMFYCTQIRFDRTGSIYRIESDAVR